MYEKMALQKYAIYKSGKECISNEWFEFCKRRKIPFVSVQLRTKYADVRFDFISLPNEYGDTIRNSSDQISAKAHRIFIKYAVKQSRCCATGHNIWFYDLPKDIAHEAASELFDMIAEYLPI